MAKIRLLTALAVVALLFTASGVLQATAITGSLSFTAFGVTKNGSNLSTSTLFTDASSLTSDVGLGDFSIIPISTKFSGFTLDLTMLSSGGAVTFSNANYGGFTATSGSIDHQTAKFLTVELLGTYTPGPAFTGLGPAPAEVSLAFTQTGNAVSGSFTLNTTTVPETGTMALLGLGALVLAGMLRRKPAI